MYTGVDPEKQDEIDWNDPFFAPIKRSEAGTSTVPDRTTTTETYEIDQGPALNG